MEDREKKSGEEVAGEYGFVSHDVHDISCSSRFGLSNELSCGKETDGRLDMGGIYYMACRRAHFVNPLPNSGKEDTSR